MYDLVYLVDGIVKVSDSTMQLTEFKEFKRYDRSEKNVFFDKSMMYIFYVYKVFGIDKENISPLYNLPESQRKIITCKSYTKPYTLDDFEQNKWVQQCVDAYLHYSRTQSERLLDAFKEDLNKFISYVETIPLTIKKTVQVEIQIPDGNNGMKPDYIDTEIEIPNLEIRLKALKDAQAYKEMYTKWEQQVLKDKKSKQTQSKLFEDVEKIAPIDVGEISLSSE
jgi:hypothetical protein